MKNYTYNRDDVIRLTGTTIDTYTKGFDSGNCVGCGKRISSPKSENALFLTGNSVVNLCSDCIPKIP